ncbi:MAG TPA: c-type cytochrome [Bryobacteraceae bacterium]
MGKPAYGVILLLAGIPLAVFGQDAGMSQADAAFVQALARADRTALENLLDADFIWIDAAGRMQPRAPVVREPPRMAISSAANAETRAYTYGDLGNVQTGQGRTHVLRVWVKRPTGWKAIVYQEVILLESPPSFTPGAGKDCENPCKTIAFTPQNETEREVAAAYSKLETAAHVRDSKGFGLMVADEFMAATSNSDKVQTKRSRMEEFDRSKDGGLAPTPLLNVRMFVFGDAVLMISEHQPDRGNPLHVTRLWVRRSGNWMETLSFQTAVTAAGELHYLSTDVENGSRLYRSNCFACHGPDGDGIPGVDFRRGQFKRASSDDDLLRVIATGVPGTAMPPTAVNDSARLALVAYLRSMHQSATGSGDAQRGRALFEGKGGCVACHRVNGNGSRLGPDLSEVGTIRSAEYLERKILAPAESILPEQRFVRVTTRQGTVITGRRLNEDTHTIQLIDQEERLRSFLKADLREYTLLTTTTMPAYRDKFSAAELADLVTYLLSLKGPDSQ